MLKKFGQTVLDYFLINYPNTSSFRLSVDDYTFSQFALMAGINEKEIISKIKMRNTDFYDDLESIAIAAYQVKIVGDIDSVMSSGSDGYYQKIRDNYSDFKNAKDDDICNKYFANQIKLWKTVQELFKNKGRKLDIPDDHPNAGRYVQYPVKSHEMKNTDLLNWADRFREKELQPYDINVSYTHFCKLFFSSYLRDQYGIKESVKRTIFNFYKIWDGRSSADIINRRPKSTYNNREKKFSETKIVMDYAFSKIEFLNRETGKKINDLATIQSLFYLNSNKVFFIQNEDNDFFSAKKNMISFGVDFIILSESKLDINDSYLENKFEQEFMNKTIYIYSIIFSKEVCKNLHIEVSQKPPFDLIGGLKKSRDCYYGFGLPVIEFSEPQKDMYVNSNLVEIESNRVILNKLQCLDSIKKNGGTVVISLLDYIPVKFTVQKFDSQRGDCADEIGWELKENRYVPSSIELEIGTEKKNIVGFNSNFEFIPIKKDIKNDNRRNFIIRNEILENRFSKIRI